MERLIIASVFGSALAFAGGAAEAIPITKTFTFEASHFAGPVVPQDPVTGSITLTFDDAAAVQNNLTPDAVSRRPPSTLCGADVAVGARAALDDGTAPASRCGHR